MKTLIEGALIRGVKLAAQFLVGFSFIVLFAIMSGVGNSGGGMRAVVLYFAEYLLILAAYGVGYFWVRNGLDSSLKWMAATALLIPPFYLLFGWRLLVALKGGGH